MTTPTPEQQWNDQLKEVTENLQEQLENRSKVLNNQWQRTEERTQEMLHKTKLHIEEHFRKKKNLLLTRMQYQQDERRLYWQQRYEEAQEADMSEMAAKFVDQLLDKEEVSHD